MSLAQSIVLEYEAIVPVTRRHLERIPQDKLGWKPDPKSMSIGQLGLHIAQSSAGVSAFVGHDSVEMPDFGFPEPATVEEIVAAFDAGTAQVRANLWDISDAAMAGSISFTAGGEAVMTFPRGGFARDIVLNHLFHHRGQLSVYLRLLGVPVPSSFGPTADEGFMPAA
jgi:uncharacterized damage-inducible protein DinB